MRKVIAAILLVTAALFAASTLGVAVAEAPTGTPVRTVNVTGVGSATIPQKADASEADASYRQAMAAAVADGQGKAEFLIGTVSVTLGAVQSVSEGGGSIECTGVSETSEGASYAEYEGERPDFPSSSSSRVAAPLAAARAIKPKARQHRKRRHPSAKKAGIAGSCKVTAEVSLVYQIA